MKTIRELREVGIKLSSTELYFSRIKQLKGRNLDFNVLLPSKGINLQRDKVWTYRQKSELIMSVFMGRFIPNVCIMSLIDNNDSENDILQVIDGKQRLTTFIDFLDNKFSVVLEDEIYYFDDLPKEYQKTFENYDIKCQMAYENYDKRFVDKNKIDWFKKINFFGTPQDVEHLERIN